MIFFATKNDFSNFFIGSNVFLVVGMLYGYAVSFRGKEGGIQVLAGPVSSIQTVGSY